MLMESFRFDEHDLQANRAGRLSLRQRRGILGGRKGMKLWTLAEAALVIAAGVILAVIDPTLTMLGMGPLRSPWIPVAAFAFGAFICLLLLPAFTSRRDQALLAKDVVRKVEGPITIVKVGQTKPGAARASPPEYYFVYRALIGERGFINVDEGLAGAMKQDDVYAVYYDGLDGRILSAELVSSADPA